MLTLTIEEAKQVLKDTVTLYLQKKGEHYVLPQDKQRPVYLEGPAGIGKTEIVKQAAEEMGIGFVSYSMTHHNRQSAVGLPAIVNREGENGMYKATEYTMSEIVDAVLRVNSPAGGILFLDEVNCVSETLTAAMLQFLQKKMFGPHTIPEGWIIVAAGNPPEYNKSVKSFDAVTRDRLRVLFLKPDLEAWLQYARKKGFHPIVVQYVKDHPQEFYYYKKDVKEQSIVTPRAWEDLSNLLQMYEANELKVTDTLIQQFLQSEKVALGFMAYYRTVHSLLSLQELRSVLSADISPALQKKIAGFSFQKRYAVLLCMINMLQQEAGEALCDVETLLKKKKDLETQSLPEEGSGLPAAWTEEELAKEKKQISIRAKELDQELDHVRIMTDNLLDFAEAVGDGKETEMLFGLLLENETIRKLSGYRRMDRLIRLFNKHKEEKDALIHQIEAWNQEG